MAVYEMRFNRKFQPGFYTNLLVAVTSLVSLVAFFAPEVVQSSYGAGKPYIDVLSVYNPAVWNGEWWRLLSTMFVHGNFMHLGFNMVALWSIGRLVEIQFGIRWLLIIYFASGLVGSACVAAFDEYLIPTVGASGGIIGLLTCLVAFGSSRFNSVAAFWQHPMGRSLFMPLILIGGLTLLVPNISFWGHTGGAVGGLVFGYLLERHKSRRFEQRETIIMGLAIALGLILLVTAVRPTHRAEFAMNRAASEIGLIPMPRGLVRDYSEEQLKAFGPLPALEYWLAHEGASPQLEDFRRALEVMNAGSSAGLDELELAMWNDLLELLNYFDRVDRASDHASDLSETFTEAPDPADTGDAER